MARLTFALCVLLCGCAGSSGAVTRIVAGETIRGRFIEGEAYAAFLRGAVAEEEGRLAEALAAYEEVRAIDSEDAEVFARIARVRCAMKAGSGAADARRALDIDPDYGPAHEALALCGVDPAAEIERAAASEPKAISAQLWLARLQGERSGDRIMALALAQPRATAFDALASLALERGQGMLAAQASIAALQRDGRMARAASDRVRVLAGAGDLDAARMLAGAIVDERARHAQPIGPLVARLAVDESLAKGDAPQATARASKGRLPLDVVAARAMLLGRPEIAIQIATLVEAADPASTAAHAVRIAAEEARGGRVSPLVALAPARRISMSAAIVYGRALARAVGQGAARTALDALACDLMLAGDALETSAAVDLAARGVLRDDALSIDAKIELALRRRVPFGEDIARAARDMKSALDARHRLLFFAWTEPKSADAARLAERLSRGATRDPLIGAALVRIASQTNQSIDAMLRERLAASAPADPIVFATLLDASPQSEPLKRRLAAVAATKAERELSSF